MISLYERHEKNIYNFLRGAFQAPWVVVDFETDGTDVRQSLSGSSQSVCMGAAFSYPDAHGNMTGEYVSFNHMDYKSPQDVQEESWKLIQTHPNIVVFGMKFELAWFEYLNLKIQGRVWCLLQMAHNIDQGHINYQLERISPDYGGKHKNRTPDMDTVIKGLGWRFISYTMMYPYACNDAIIEGELFPKLLKRYKALGYTAKFMDREAAKAKVLIKMESIGIRVDQDLAKSEIAFGEKRMFEIVQLLDGRNPKSPIDCKYLLIDRLGLPILDWTDGGKPSFKKEVMKKYDEILEDPTNDFDDESRKIANLIIEFRGWQTAISLNLQGALNNISSDGKVRTQFKTWITPTSRLSSVDPNMMQLPKTSTKRWNGNLKAVYIAEDDEVLWDFDYDQLELRIATAIAGELKLVKVFKESAKDPSKPDLFTVMSRDLGIDRDPTKTFVYSTSYGAGDDKVKKSLGITLARAKQIRGNFIRAYANIYKLSRKSVASFAENGYIRLWTGRIIARSKFSRKNWGKDFAAFNWLIQGSGAEIVTEQMIRLYHRIDWVTCKMVLQTHDALTFGIKKGHEDYWIPIIKEIMEDVSFLKNKHEVPFTVTYKQWGTKG